MLPQTKDHDPYKYNRENFILSCLELRTEVETDDCEFLETFIQKFDELDSMSSDDAIRMAIGDISRFQCREAYNFLETQIKSNLSEKVRCDALVLLSWSLNYDYLPCIVEYAKRDSLSVQEKLALGGAFMIFGVYTSNSELKDESIRFLDEVCYDFSSGDITENCIWSYVKLDEKSAINYFNSLFEQDKSRKPSAALFLAWLGEYGKSLSYFTEIAKNGGVGNQILYAIDGLAVIGTEEAIRLIEELSRSENEVVAKKAQRVLGNFDMKGSEK
jgi:HEAT repeat protein